MKITVDLNRCKQCGLCIAFCPKKVFGKAVDGSPEVNDPNSCVNCKQCVLRCPDLAITVEKD